MKIGARVFKTGLAITLSVMASMFIIPGSDGMLAGIGAAYSTQPSVRKSVEVFISRVISNIIGGLIAVIMVQAIGNHPLAVGITAILTIAILNALKLGEFIGLAVVTLIVIMLGSGENFNHHTAAVMRVSETLIGVTITFLVNLIVYPPKYDGKFFQTLEFITSETLMWIRASLRKNAEYSVMHRDIKWARAQMRKLIELFDLIKGEMFFNRKKRYYIMRKSVVYKHMCRTTEAAIKLLRVLHENESVYMAFPDEMRVTIRERLETLMSAHEQILMKFNGKVPPREVNFMTMNLQHREEYMQCFFNQARVQENEKEMHHFEGNGVIHIMSAIYHYEEELTNLNRLVRSFKLRSQPEKATLVTREIH
ncbi:aromatic acid exporter family protein [Aerococcaceae bacterium NML160702]|nr:aromatic acid exporter family protein [Aerococcaceae bacterium NML160702]